MENENVGGEVNNVSIEGKEKDSNKKMIVKIVVGVLVLLAVIGIAAFLFWRAIAIKVVDTGKDAINSVVNVGQSLVDDAMNNSSDLVNEVQNTIKDNVSSVQNSANNKIAITADKFREIMNDKAYVLEDVTVQFSQYGDYVKKVCVARKSGYQIEFFELANVANAIESYNTNKTKFESQKGSTSSYFTVSKGNYNMYTLTTNGKYKYICRVDNTFIYMDVAEEYKDEVKSIVNELGY